tara:strand:+ start:2086 stop:2523 length:438 start_codon:yes stop_codon:yes gene_type:complete
MAITFTNNFKNILDKLQSVLRTEFKNTLPVYVGEVNEKAGSQYLRLDPVGSELIEYNVNAELREFTINFFLYFGDKSDSRTKLDAVLRLVSRIEALIHDNVSLTLTDSSNLFNNRFETTTLDAIEDSENYVVQFEFRGQHLANLD